MNLIKIFCLIAIALIYENNAQGQCPSQSRSIVDNSKFKKVDKLIKRDKASSAKKIYENLKPSEKQALKENFNDYGGSYKQGDSSFTGRKGLYEVNHTPPKAAYENTPYKDVNVNDMPAALMEYGDHRAYHTTGSSGDVTQLRERVFQGLFKLK